MSVISLLLDGGRDSKIRGKPDADGLEHWSIYEFIACACEKDSEYGRVTFTRLLNDKQYQEELKQLIKYMVLPGKYSRPVPVMTIRGLQRLLMILGGKVAGQYRAILETTFTRVLSGDKTLIKVIEANANAVGGVQQMCRDALELDADAGGVPDDLLEDVALGKRKMTEDEHAHFRLEMKEREAALLSQQMDNVEKFCGVMNMLDGGWKQDGRLVIQVQDWLKNTALGSGGQQLAISNGQLNPNQSISVSQVAMEMGMRMKLPELSEVGKLASKEYQKKYGKRPSTHKQHVDNVLREVNSYTERDRDIIVAAIRVVRGGN